MLVNAETDVYVATSSPYRQHAVEIAHRSVTPVSGGPEDESEPPYRIVRRKAREGAKAARHQRTATNQTPKEGIVFAGDVKLQVDGSEYSKVSSDVARETIQKMVDKARETDTPPSYTVLASGARAEGKLRRANVITTTRSAKVILNTEKLAHTLTPEGREAYTQAVAATDIVPTGEGSAQLENIALELSFAGLNKLGAVDAIQLNKSEPTPRYVDGQLNPAFVEAFRHVYWMQAVSIPPDVIRGRRTDITDDDFLHSPWMNTVVENVFGSELHTLPVPSSPFSLN